MHRLINLSEATSIAIHSLTLISKANSSINASKISDLSGFSKNHLSKVMQVLVKQGYLSSNRGPKGGFRLIKDASSIRLLDIYNIFEGNIENSKYIAHSELCPFKDDIYGDIIDEIRKIFIDSFSNRTIADIKWKDSIEYTKTDFKD